MELLETVSVHFRYPVIFTRDLFHPDNPALAEWVERSSSVLPCRCTAFVDAGVAQAHANIAERIAGYIEVHGDVLHLAGDVLVLPGGEQIKNSFDAALKVIRHVRRARLCRQSLVLAVGGGAFLDAVGFAASLVHRGVRLVRAPTTVLAQDDSGVGVKTGVNLGGQKNFLGTFAPPAAVFNDSLFLTTLSQRDWIAGVAEAYKVAVVRDASFLDWLIRSERPLRRRRLETMEQLIRRCAALHLEHIALAGDPFEQGQARPLDFGHWAAHKLEMLTCHELRHGEAVAIGMALDLCYAALAGLISEADAERVIHSMGRVGLPLWHDVLDLRNPDGDPVVFDGIEEFREHLGGELHVTLPKPLGRRMEVTSLDRGLLEQALQRVRRIAAGVRGHATQQR